MTQIKNRVKRSACIALSLMLAAGAINVPIHAQEQEVQAVAEAAPVEEPVVESVKDPEEEPAAEELQGPAEEPAEEADENSAEEAVEEEKEKNAPAEDPEPEASREEKNGAPAEGEKEEPSKEEVPSEAPSKGAGDGEEESSVFAVRFINADTGEGISKDCVTVDADTDYEDGAFIVRGHQPGNVITYKVQVEGCAPVEDNITLYDAEQTISVSLQKKAVPAEGSVSISKTYGDKDFSVYDYVSPDAGYDGDADVEVVSGSGVVSADKDGTIRIIGAGPASVRISFNETDSFAASSVEATIDVEKCHIGEISADDIVWDTTEKECDGTDDIKLTGTVSDSAGIMEGDTVKVTAEAKTASAEVGTWDSTITVSYFEGADGYDISLSEAGPLVTIKRVSQARISYDDNSPVNEKYFSHNRTMTATIADFAFDESLISMTIGVNGSEDTYTIAQVRDGGVKGVELVSGPQTEEGATVFSLLFGGQDTAVEDAYTFSMSYDRVDADTTGCAAPYEFVVDEVLPELSVVFTDGTGSRVTPGKTEALPFYATEPITATLVVRDGSFDSSGIDVTVTSKDSEGNDTGSYPQESVDKASSSVWDRNGRTHSYTMDVLEEDANYAFSAGYTDLAGNPAEGYGPGYITFDKEAPAGRVMVTTSDGERKEYSRLLEEKEMKEGKYEHTFNLFDRYVTLEDASKDAVSGIDSVMYYLADVDGGAGETFTQEEDLESLKWEEYKEGIKIDTDRILVIYEKITDKAGNTTYISSGGGLIIDNKDPGKPQLTVSSVHQRIFFKDMDVLISAADTDSDGDGIYSGIREIRYKMVSDLTGETTLEGNKEAGSSRVKALQETVTIPAVDNNWNAVTLYVEAEDYTGNTSSTEKRFSFDTTDPEISIDFDDSDVVNGHYFNSTRTASVTFHERNFLPGKSKLMVNINGEPYTFTMAQLADGEGAAYGLGAAAIADSQADTPWAMRTDDRLVTYTVLFGDGEHADFDYDGIVFTCEDEAGNKAEKAFEEYPAFTVDKVAPKVSVSYRDGSRDVTDRIGTNPEAPYFTQGSIIPTVTVVDRKFTRSGVSASVSQKDSGGRNVDAYKESSLRAMNEADWERDGSTHTFVMDGFTKDANYGFSIEVADLAGNKAGAYAPHYFTVDKTSPSGKLIVTSGDGTGTYSGYTGSIKFMFMDNAPIAVASEASDDTSGVANVSYYKYVPPVNTRGTFSGLALDRLRNVKWSGWDGTLTIEPDSQAVVYARIADRAGNVVYINTAGGMIADRTSPAAPEIDIRAGNSSGFYNGNVPVHVSVEDVTSGGTFSGLRSVTVEVLRDGSVTQTSSKDFSPKGNRVKSYATDITVDAQTNNSNNVLVRVTATDYAGNVSGMEKTLKIDVTAPRIEVTYDNNSPANGRYYDRPRTATVTVYDRNFDSSGVRWSFSGSPRISGWTIGGMAGVSDDNASTCTVVFDEDGEYTFTLSVTDEAGNSASYGRTDDFVIDRTAPVFSVSFDGGSPSNGKYYNHSRTAYITVTDLSFDESLFTAAVRASLDGKTITAPGVSGWTHRGMTHTAQVTFADDGDYSFTLDAKDLAGNTAKPYSEGEFTIDMTSPSLSFFGVEDGSANSGEAAPGVRYEDINIGGIARLTLKGYRHAEKEVTGTLEELEKGGSIRLEDFARVIDEDDVYTLTAEASDLAGNVSKKSITFSVNRFGSNYFYSDMTEAYLKDYYHKDSSSIVIYEVNVDAVHGNAVTIYHNGRSVTVPEGSYKIEDISEKEGWKKYMYSLPASLFEEEGIYEIFVSSVDRAGNRQDNKVKEVPITFAVDRTAPSAVITGVEDGEFYDEFSREAGVTVTDNMAMGTLRVLIDGKEVAVFDAEQINEAEGKLAFTIGESDEWQEITVDFEDAAGNKGAAEKCRVLVSTNTWAKLVHSNLIWLPALLAILAGGAWAVGKRKKDGN